MQLERGDGHVAGSGAVFSSAGTAGGGAGDAMRFVPAPEVGANQKLHWDQDVISPEERRAEKLGFQIRFAAAN